MNEMDDAAFAAFREADPTVPGNDTSAIRAKVNTDNAPIATQKLITNKFASRRPVWFVPSAVATVIALSVGSAAGYSLAASGSAAGTDTTQSMVTDSALAPAMEAGTRNSSSSMSSSGAGAADKMMAPYSYGRVLLKPAGSLSDSAGTAEGYRISDSDVDRKALAKKLGEVFGLTGLKTLPDKAGYVVGDDTYVKAGAGVNGIYDTTASWYFSNPENSPWGACNNPIAYDSSSANPIETGSSDGGAAGTLPAPAVCEPVSGTAPSDEAAIAQAKEIFAELGLSEAQATWKVNSSNWFGSDAQGNALPFVHVEAALTVDGLATGMLWTIDIGPDGKVANASGMAAQFVATPAYDIVSPKQAALRSSDIAWINLGPTEKWQDGQAYPMLAAEVKTSANTAVSTKVSKDAEGRPLIAAQFEKVTVKSSSPTLISYSLSDGSMVLLPGYELTGEGRTFMQIAIADKYLAK